MIMNVSFIPQSPFVPICQSSFPTFPALSQPQITTDLLCATKD